MAFLEDDTEQLLRRVRRDEANAVSDLLNLHQEQLKKAIVARMDHRLQGRIDASDVIQDTMIEASRRLTEYLENPAIPFYPWLRAIAMNRLTDLYRRHILSQKRSIDREAAVDVQMSDQSVYELARHLAAPGNTPSEEAGAKESQQQVRTALSQLKPEEREVLILMYLENMSSSEIAVVQGITDRSVRRRHRHAIEQLGKLLR